MLGLKRRRHIGLFIAGIQIVATGTIVAFGAILKADLAWFADIPPALKAVTWMQSASWAVVVFGPFFVVFLQWARRTFGSPWAWGAVQQILDGFRDELFKKCAMEPLDHHRVTLFKHRRFVVRWCHPRLWCCGWLVAVARSKHMTKENIRRFRAPDDPDLCEGVAGMAWRHAGWVAVPKAGEPPLPVLVKNAGEPDIATYAAKTGVTTAWVKCQLYADRRFAASYAAVTIQHKGQPWGVLVVDSRGSDSFDPANLGDFIAYGKLLTPLLERI